MFSVDFLEKLRLNELEHIKAHISPSVNTVLEIGAGSGFQARHLSEVGLKVVSLDTHPAKEQHYPVIKYDGVSLPFDDSTFDMVFSSNTLEHVENLPELLREIERVLRKGGNAIHTMPTGFWAFWSFWTHFIDAVFKSYVAAFSKKEKGRSLGITIFIKNILGFLQHILSIRYPPSHGGEFNPLCEWVYFSETVWRRRFLKNKINLVKVIPIRLFYTGYMIFGNNISLRARRFFSFILGSSSKIYITRSR